MGRKVNAKQPIQNVSNLNHKERLFANKKYNF